jgi:hypothetical protein
MKNQVRGLRTSSVKFFAYTIGEGRIRQGAKPRNPPPQRTTSNESRAVRCEVGEAVHQQWADDAP